MSRKLLKSTGTVTGMTFISRVLGFVRDMVLAQTFGAGAASDAFFVAFKIPNFMRRLFAEGAFSLAFVPVFSEYKATASPEALRELASRVAGTLGGFLLVVTLVGQLASPALVAVFAPGFLDDPERYELARDMLRLTFPYLFFISLTAFAGGMLNSFGRFAVPAFTPVLLNVCLITAAVGFAPHFARPIMALAWGVFFAGLVQLLFQLPALRRLDLLVMPRWGWRSPGVQRIMKLMIPALFGSSVAQINLLFDTLLASFLVTGSVSWLYYSDRLMEFPLGMFGVALGTVILPSLSRHHAQNSTEDFSRTLDWALRWALLMGAPAAAGLAMLAGPMLTTLFQYGAFSGEDARKASHSLIAYAIGLQAFMLIKVLAPAFYSRQDTRTPVRIGIIAMVANMAMNVALIFPLAHVGLALATSLSAFLNAGLLLRRLRRDDVYRPGAGWLVFLGRVAIACLAMVALLYWGTGALETWAEDGALGRSLRLLGWISAGAAMYGSVLFLGGVRPRDLRITASS
jgi:putative peptidoglycan lipid II flippase